MTTINEARETVYERVRDLWTDTVFTFEGDEFKEPESDPWLRVSVRQRGGGQSTLGGVGNRRFRREASVHGQVFVPLQEGLKQNDTLAKTFNDLFEGVPRISGLEFGNGGVSEIGPSGNKQQYNVEIEFSYQERK